MKVLFIVGFIVLALGICSFFVPVPHSEEHAVSAGDLRMGVTTHHEERVPPAVSIVLVVVGAGMMMGGRGKS
jgi:hypothetical protein